MTPQLTAAASALGRLMGGSHRAHEALQEAVLQMLAPWRIPAVPIHTGPRVRPREGGGWELRGNPRQHGVSDVIACFPPAGLLALLELKTGAARRSKAQERLAERFKRAGAVTAVIRSVRDLEVLLDQYVPRARHGGSTCEF